MKISYDPELDALSITFRETTVTTKLLAEGIAADYPPRRAKADWLVWKFSMPKAFRRKRDHAPGRTGRRRHLISVVRSLTSNI
jgi:hypothetical protein